MKKMSAQKLVVLGLAACATISPWMRSEAQTHAAGSAGTAQAAVPAIVVATTQASTFPEPAELDYVLPGALTRDVGPEQLRRLFGSANVKIDEQLPGTEGETYRGVVLFDHDPSRRAYVYYQDEQQLRGLRMISVIELGTVWRLDNGVATGMSLDELVRRNGKPLRFQGLDQHSGGFVHDWKGGKLDAREGAAARPLVSLGYSPDAPHFAIPTGYRGYASNDPKYPRQGELLHVTMIGLSFRGEVGL
ncbi:hypothetical protein [Lysobacter sp. CA196]|uniref:hypothetical protein n=1 Tax=Lysobacter sp. CA196 TaxID=3455606 RepID=UPI003F8D3679